MLRSLSDVSANLAMYADELIALDDLICTHGGPYQYLAEITKHRKFQFVVASQGTHSKQLRGVFEICSTGEDPEHADAYAKVLRLEQLCISGTWESVPIKSLENYPPLEGFRKFEPGEGYVRFVDPVEKRGPLYVLLIPLLD